MKLIIDISDKTYEIIRDMMYFYNPQRSGRAETKEIFTAIKNGIPLSKGHGRLIDTDTLPINEVSEEKYNWECGETIHHTLDVVYWDDILNAPTIIEADKENK